MIKRIFNALYLITLDEAVFLEQTPSAVFQ